MGRLWVAVRTTSSMMARLAYIAAACAAIEAHSATATPRDRTQLSISRLRAAKPTHGPNWDIT